MYVVERTFSLRLSVKTPVVTVTVVRVSIPVTLADYPIIHRDVPGDFSFYVEATAHHVECSLGLQESYSVVNPIAIREPCRPQLVALHMKGVLTEVLDVVGLEQHDGLHNLSY